MGVRLPLYPGALEDSVLLVKPATGATDHGDELELEPATEHSGFNLAILHALSIEVASGLCARYFIPTNRS